MGTLTTTDGNNNDADTYMMTMGYSYDDDSSRHNFNFYFEADREIILSKDLVVFTTGAGIDVSAENPGVR